MTDAKLLRAMADRLANWPANGKPPNDDATMALQVAGLIAGRTQTKPCAACGTPRPSWSYMAITAAGEMFLAAYRAPAS